MEAATSKIYRFEDLQVGMTVRQSELKDIFGKSIILINSKLLDNKDVEGEVAYIENGNEAELEKWFTQKEMPITPIYQAEDLRDGICYDE